MWTQWVNKSLIWNWTTEDLQKVSFIFKSVIHVLKTSDLPLVATAICFHKDLYVPDGKHSWLGKHGPGKWCTFTRSLVPENPIEQTLFGKYVHMHGLIYIYGLQPCIATLEYRIAMHSCVAALHFSFALQHRIAALRCSILLQYCFVAFNCSIALLHCTAARHCIIVLHCSTFHCAALHCIALHCIALPLGFWNGSHLTRLRRL